MFYASIVFEIFAYKYDFFVQLVQSILKYNRGIYMQNVLLRLREVQPSLSSTERQIAQFILENPDETTTLTIRDLARRSFSSPSSVVRICRVIGFQGYKELRHALTESIRLGGRTVLEQYIQGREIQVAVLGDAYLPAVEIIPKNAYFDYESKYQKGGAVEILPRPYHG